MSASADSTAPDLRSRITASRVLVLALALVALLLFFTALSAVDFESLALHDPTFLSWNNAIDVAGSCAINLILAVGSTFVIIAGGIDLSVGRLIALTHVLMVVVAGATGSLMLGVLGCLAAGLAAGLFNGAVTVRFRIPSFIVTLGSMMMARGLAMVAAGGHTIGCDFRAPVALQRYLPIGVSLLVMLVGHVMLTRSVFGRHVFAVGGSAETARLCGINVGRIVVLTFLLSGLCTALAGLVFWVRQGTGDPLAGDGLELYAIAAVIVGGTSLSGGRGSILGTFLGALIMGVLAYGLLFLGVPTPWQWVIIGSVVIATVLLDRLKKTDT
jgi:ribose/xylose/arabinose/galactoside ABC-type transport system permease subunit